MTDLAWGRFLELQGDPRKNWEILCREVVRRNYQAYGSLLTRKQQPGVEFHLEVNRPGSALGEVGRHWGWQCKWYEPDDLRSGESRLRSGRRSEVENAIEKSEKHVAGLSDWVLWTRDKLGKDDSEWLDGLREGAPFRLHLADEETLIGMLSGDAAVLRETWFGELMLSADRLNQNRLEALAPVRHRYIEELHVETPAESFLQSVMPDSRLDEILADLQRSVEEARLEMHQAESEMAWGQEHRLDTTEIQGALDRADLGLRSLRSALENGDLPQAEEISAMLPDDEANGRLEEALETFRAAPGRGLPRDLAGAERTVNRVWRFEKELAERLATPLLGVVGRAGAGKTHLAASITGPTHSARGVLLLGLDFGAQIADDDLARLSRLGQGRDELLEAMEAVGVREGRRVPLVIDGLNEADEPAKWRAPLARLAARLSALPHVVGIVTVRPRFVELTLPDGTPIKEIPGLVGVEEEAVERYFTYYKIEADHRALHWWRPSDALLLSIFCRTVNPERVATVGAADLPDSLHEVFDSFLGGVFGRIGAVMEIDQADVRRATLRLAYLSLETGTRGLERAEASRALGDEERAPHRKALRFHLENEEIISREATDTGEEVLWGYDLLAGHLIASSILERHADRREIGGPDLSSAIAAHPLVEDIIVGLSGLLAKEDIELVGLMGDRAELLGEAALASVRLDGPEIGGAGLEALARLFTERPTEVLEAISSVTLRSDHPMNGRFLDTLLSGMAVWERDLVWTEWIRGQVETVGPQLSELGRAVREGREEVDLESALCWLSWLLTTTDKRLRDEATYVLYELGRAAPELLQARCIQMLDVNDSFVAEGLLAAAYGASMAAQAPGSPAAEATISFAGELRARIIGDDASQPTTNWLIREYAYRATQLAAWLSGGSFEAPMDKVQPPLPAPDGPVERFERDSEGWSAMDGAFGMDFSNYTIGHLFDDRANYQDDHERFIEVTGEIRARVADLGWSEEMFGEIDRSIGAREVTRGQDPQKVERYGKKYGWIAYFEAAGRLSDEGRLEAALGETGRLPDMPIDPSFPTEAGSLPFELEPWASRAGEDREWILAGEVQIPDRLLQTEAFGEDERWIAIDGFLRHQPGDSERRVFCFLRGILALEGWASVEEKIAADGVDNDLVPRSPSDYYCFAGEAPWSPTFDAFNTDADGIPRPDVNRLGRHFEEGPEVELLGVDFSWESYHSVLNEVEVGTFPGKAFALSAGLRRRPEHSEFETEDGRLGAVSVRVSQDEWRGHVLYVREDLLKTYVAAREGDWGWVVWGEREMFPAEWRSEPPDWLNEVRSLGQDRFHRVTSLAQLEGAP